MATYGFHSDAAEEYLAATQYYLDHASPRYLLTRFPYSIYYRWEPERDRVAIYAVMHFSRRPGYWRERLT
ncbi:MAG TPA: hypothetical protein VK557_19290 [Pyrinomonadaceae bacterium]|nr:hypothetical protein [Pyrinomonadaceae bacterium]